MNKIEFLAIGDIVTDAFIRLKDAKVHCNVKTEECELCVRFGDKVPYENVHVVDAVGNSPNAAVSAVRLGLKTALITNVGEDEAGRNCIKYLKNQKVITNYIKKHKGKDTNYHYVLSYDTDRTILIKHTAFKYVFPKIGPVDWVYLSSLAENSLPYHKQILAYLKKHKDVKLAFQPGTFQMKFGYEKLKDIYKRTEIFFCNKEEAQRILKTKESDIEKLSKMIQELGPKMVAISDGVNGAYFYNEKDELYHIPIYKDTKKPIDRTGAGDAFSSTFTAGLAMNMPPLEALKMAPINSMSVVQYIGAQEGLLNKEKIKTLLKKAPKDYEVKKIN